MFLLKWKSALMNILENLLDVVELGSQFLISFILCFYSIFLSMIWGIYFIIFPFIYPFVWAHSMIRIYRMFGSQEKITKSVNKYSCSRERLKNISENSRVKYVRENLKVWLSNN